jgi:hypothetical protein
LRLRSSVPRATAAAICASVRTAGSSPLCETAARSSRPAPSRLILAIRFSVAEPSRFLEHRRKGSSLQASGLWQIKAKAGKRFEFSI